MEDLKVEILKGKTLKEIKVSEDKSEILFISDKNEKWKMFHSQDCCECVLVEDICGELEDLIGSPLLMAEEVTSKEHPEDKKRNAR